MNIFEKQNRDAVEAVSAFLSLDRRCKRCGRGIKGPGDFGPVCAKKIAYQEASLKDISEPWDETAIQKMQKIQNKVNAGKRLTKLEEAKLEEYDNTHVDVEFSLIIGLNRDFTDEEKQKIVNVCVEAVRKLGYHEVEMA